MNNIVIERRHLAPIMIFTALYLVLIISFSTTGDRYIYSILKYEDSSSWILTFGIFIALPFVYAVLQVVSEVKFNLIDSTVGAKRRVNSSERNSSGADGQSLTLIVLP